MTMADYFPGEIRIGGPIPRAVLPELIRAILAAGPSLGDYGRARATQESLEEALRDGRIVELCDEQACGGQFADLEAFLVERGIHFDRHSDARHEFDAQNVHCRGKGPPLVVPATQGGESLIRRQGVLEALDDPSLPAEDKLKAIRQLVASPQLSPLEPIRLLPEEAAVSKGERIANGRPGGVALCVIITVSGGVADVLFKPSGVAVALYDYDVEASDEDDPGISRDPDGQPCCLREWGAAGEVAGCRHWPVVQQAVEGSYSRPWKCPDCGWTVDCSYEDLAEAGSPICLHCDSAMEML